MKKKYVAEYDDDYNGEDLDIGGVEIDRGWFIVAFSFNSSTKIQTAESSPFVVRFEELILRGYLRWIPFLKWYPKFTLII